MPLSPKSEVSGLEPAVHGGINYAEFETLGITPRDIIDFSVCINPYGPPGTVCQALAKVEVHNYPDTESSDLRRALAIRLGVREQNIIVGSGSTEIIRLATQCYLTSGENVLIPQPSYGDYERACKIAGAAIYKYPQAIPPLFGFNLHHIVAAILHYQPRLVFIANPNNPTGHYLPELDISVILHSAPKTLLVLDEAYVNLTDVPWSSICHIARGNLLVVRSMTKDYALAGLRLGFAVGHEEIIANLRKAQSPWSVTSVAQQAGLAALQAAGYLEHCRHLIARARKYLVRELDSCGLIVVPSDANYMMVKVGDAGTARAALMKKGFLVRDCTSFGLPEYIRLGVRTLPECRRLIKAIKATLKDR